jgi:hypothetical protein
MDQTERGIEIPYAVQRAIHRYKPEFRDAIARLVARRLRETGGHIRPEEIGECASEIFVDIISGEDRRREVMEEVAMKAYHAGKFRRLDDVISDLRNELQRSPS